ncbi:DUF687 family protein, partial [Candidatus Chlamydia corallus]|uniref:DUF687 family protein n=1 Tax=Candidatus Chlamydia corallus TaxID=2038470 RepID=UPI00195C6FA6
NFYPPPPDPSNTSIPLITISPPSSDSSSAGSLAEEISMFIEGGPRSPSPSPEFYEVVCIAGDNNDDTTFEDSLVSTVYINGSWQTQQEAISEAMHISGLRNEAVRLMYNNGSGMFWLPCLRRTSPGSDHPLCHGLSTVVEQFFSHPQNQDRDILIIFYGDGGSYIQRMLESTQYSDRIMILGISPSVFIQGDYRVQNYRVSGDYVSSFDSLGAYAVNTSTLPYSSGLEGVFCPSVRCPTFNWALRFGERCLLRERVRNAGDEGAGSVSSPMLPPQGSSSNMAVVINPSDSRAMERLAAWLDEGPTSADREINPYPQNCPDIALAALFAISRISGLLQEWVLASVHYNLDLQICYSLILMHTTCAVRYFFLLITNYPQLRERVRAGRIFAQALYVPSVLVLVFDYFNLLRRLWMPFPILQGVFVSASTVVGSLIFMECLRWSGRPLRNRIQQFAYRQATGNTLPVGRVRVIEMEAIAFALGFAYSVYNIYFPLSIMVLNQVGLQVPRLLTRSNVSSVYDLQNKTAQQNWQTGDVLAVSLTMNFIITSFVLFVNIWFLLRSVLHHCRRRRR